jgi:hypothetical protein
LGSHRQTLASQPRPPVDGVRQDEPRAADIGKAIGSVAGSCCPFVFREWRRAPPAAWRMSDADEIHFELFDRAF